MKKTKLIIAMLIIFTMVMSIMPFNVFKTFAATTVKLQLNNVIDFAGGAGGSATLKCSDDGINTVDVTATGNTFNITQENHDDGNGNLVSSYFLTVDQGSTVTFTFSSADASLVIGEGREFLDENNSYTFTATEDKPVSLEFDEAGQQLGFDGKIIQFDGAVVSNDKITFSIPDSEVTTTATVTGEEGTYVFNENGGLEVDDGYLQNIVIKFDNNFDRSKMSVYVIDGDNNIVLETNGDNEVTFAGVNIEDNGLHLGIQYKNNGGGEPVGGTEDIAFDLTWNDTYLMVDINGKEVLGDSELQQDVYTFNNIIAEQAGETDETKTNVIKLTPQFGNKEISECTINGVVYKLNRESENENVEYYDYGWFITVPGAAKYVISATGDSSIPTPRTIIWVNPDYVPEDEDDAKWVSDFTIEHGIARVIEVYDENDNLIDPSSYVGIDADKYGLNDGFGWVSILPGSRVIFEFIPEYGYQLTGIAINETPLDAVEDMNRFEVYIPNDSGNLHFAATFTKTEDIVKAESEKIKSGEITLGNSLEGGSAQLTVNDVELSSDKIKGFENAAGEYTISNYLDIDLYNVFYKGKKDSEDVWATKIDELSNEATITLKLADGLTADDIVIVHNVHDGDTYEIIQIESYDPATNTITFKTKSFSNYAIATKVDESNTASEEINNTKNSENIDNTENSEKDENSEKNVNSEKNENRENSPQTGDTIRNTFIVFALATVAFVVTFKCKKNRSVRKH